MKAFALILLLGLISLSSFASTLAQPVPYTVSGKIGTNFDVNYGANEELLESFVQAVKNEGFEVKVNLSSSVVHKSYYKSKNESLADVVVNKTKGCEIFDAGCLRYVQNLNRREVLPANLDTLEGEITLPAQETRFEVSIAAGNSYRESKVNGVTHAFISKKLNDLTIILDPIRYGRITQICFSECTNLFDLTIE